MGQLNISCNIIYMPFLFGVDMEKSGGGWLEREISCNFAENQNHHDRERENAVGQIV